jgi:hypothetical protein
MSKACPDFEPGWICSADRSNEGTTTRKEIFSSIPAGKISIFTENFSMNWY